VALNDAVPAPVARQHRAIKRLSRKDRAAQNSSARSISEDAARMEVSHPFAAAAARNAESRRRPRPNDVLLTPIAAKDQRQEASAQHADEAAAPKASRSLASAFGVAPGPAPAAEPAEAAEPSAALAQSTLTAEMHGAHDTPLSTLQASAAAAQRQPP
jgi:hypothetical protein